MYDFKVQYIKYLYCKRRDRGIEKRKEVRERLSLK